MPSGITHILLARRLQDELTNATVKNIFAFGSDALIVGAVGPDLPYASIADSDLFFSSESPLADRFHYEKTNQIPLQSLERVRFLKDQMDERPIYLLFSFFMGYISHIYADGIMHPFVRDKVGNYAQNKSAHRSLEMQLDVLLIEEFTKRSGFPLELNNTKIHNQLLDFYSDKEFRSIIRVFSQIIYSVYNENYSVKKISGWIKGLYRLFAIAEGKLPKIYRVLDANTFFFRNRADIDAEKVLILQEPIDREVNFLRKERIHFIDDCVSEFYNKFKLIAQKAYEYVFLNGEVLTEIDIPPIDLDTGRLLSHNNLDLIPELWK
jgi:hypothetical protein